MLTHLASVGIGLLVLVLCAFVPTYLFRFTLALLNWCQLDVPSPDAFFLDWILGVIEMLVLAGVYGAGHAIYTNL
jgi:hypothetical protein